MRFVYLRPLSDGEAYPSGIVEVDSGAVFEDGHSILELKEFLEKVKSFVENFSVSEGFLKERSLINTISSWQPGHFVDNVRYKNWSIEQKRSADEDEHLRVRPYSTGNAVCICGNTEDASWIAERLNLASNLEGIVREFFITPMTKKEFLEKIKEFLK